MNKFLLKKFIVLLFLIANVAIAQKVPFSITGKILTSANKPVEFGNVIALSVKDSSLLKGAPFENGNFTLDAIINDSVLVKITSVGYSNFIKLIYRPDTSTLIDIGEVILKDNTLNEVTISAKMPLFEIDGEKVKVNVESTSLNSVGTALDVLRRSPGVMVSSTDNVSVFGKGTAIIYLDGLLISSVDILKSLPSNEIKSIEIIRNPSAKYDAAGMSVINIITIKNSLEGFNGTLIQNLLYGKDLFTYSGLRLNYRKAKWSTNVSYGTNMGKQWNSDAYKRSYKTHDTINTELNNFIYDKQKYSNVHYYRAGINYRMDSTSTFGMQYNGFYNMRNDVSDNINSVVQNSTEQYQLHTVTNSQPKLVNNGVNLNYSKNLDTLGSELFVAAQYGNFVIQQTGKIYLETKYNNFVFDEQKRNSNTNNIKIAGAQIDFTKAFNKTWKLSSGVKESNISKVSDIKFENLQADGSWLSDPLYLNGFQFKENIAAVYSELRFKKKKINVRLGGRAELTNSEGYSKILNTQVFNRRYINFFPSGYFGYDISKDLLTCLTVTSRINRPTFQDLDPFINYIDSLSSFRGNPYLLPEYTNGVEASLVYMKEANLTFGYSQTNGAMRLVVDKLNSTTDAFTATTKNLKKSETYSFGVTIPYELTWWTTANYFGYFLNTFMYEQNGILIKNNKPSFSIYLYDEFRFKKLFSLELIYEYTSSGVDGIFISKPFSQLNATIKRSFFDNKLTCRFIASDMFNKYVMSGQSNIPLYKVNYTSRVNMHYFMLAINYKFGKLKSNNYKNRSVSDDEYNRVKTGK